MALLEFDRRPSEQKLRSFGVILAAGLGLAGGLCHFGSAPAAAPVCWTGAAVVALVWFWVRPLRWAVYLGWVYVTYPLGWLFSHMALAALYFLVLTPIGLVLRVFGRDRRLRRADPGANTYWIRRDSLPTAESHFRQF
jgi:uncharacterized membrane protein YraQ (UPF0718 family)